jgi:dGTPase
MLNEDLSEAIALAHDIGHTPFGHPGEFVMSELMNNDGGFDHNSQSLRVVDILERKYPNFDGLNLSFEVRSGLVKHRTPKSSLDGKLLPPQPSLESQAADIADDITYYGHDVDDALDAGLIDETNLETLQIWQMAVKKASQKKVKDKDKFRVFVVRCLIDMMVENVIIRSDKNLSERHIETPESAQKCPVKLISFSPDFLQMTSELRKFLYHNVYYNRDVASINEAAAEKIKALFNIYSENPKYMGKIANSRIPKDGLKRAVADYIAGMTDRFALLEHKRCCETHS